MEVLHAYSVNRFPSFQSTQRGARWANPACALRTARPKCAIWKFNQHVASVFFGFCILKPAKLVEYPVIAGERTGDARIKSSGRKCRSRPASVFGIESGIEQYASQCGFMSNS